MINICCRFCSEKGCLASSLQKTTVKRLLPHWRTWAAQKLDLTSLERYMTWGPTLAAMPFARAVIGGQSFRIAKRQQSRSSDSLVMTRAAYSNAAQFGELLQFYKFRPPWVRPETEQQATSAETVNIAHVRWYRTLGLNRKLDNAPEVSRSFWDDPNGILRWCESPGSTPIALVPHLSKADRWQVMHVDSDFCSRAY